MGKGHCRKLWSCFAVNWKKKGCLFCQKAILPAAMQCQDDRKYMLVLTDTGDLEPDLDISKKAKDLCKKTYLPVAFYLVIRYNEFWMRKTQGLFSLCKMKTGERWI